MAKKELFGVFSPVLGEKKDFPTILLDKTVQVDNRDIYRKYGEVHRRKMREGDMLPEMHIHANAASDPIGNETDATTGWSGVSCTLTSETTDPQTGTYHLKGVSTAVGGRMEYDFTAVIGKTYTVSIWAKRGTQGTTQKIYAWVGVATSPSESITAGAWKKYTYTVIATATTITIRIFAAISGAIGDEVYVDNVSIRGEKTPTPDANPILHYHTFVKRSTGMQYFLAFTKAHIYLWDSTNKEWDVVFTCQSDCTEWDTITYNDMVIATNNVDMVLKWNASGYFMPLQNTSATSITVASKENPCHITAAGHGLTTGDRVFIKDCGGMVEINNLQFVVTVDSPDIFSLDGINSLTGYTTYTSGGTVVEFQGIEYVDTPKFLTQAKYVSTFENYLILGYTTEGTVLYPQRERWNAIGDETAWRTGDAGSKETEGSDRIVGFKIYSGQFIIFKEKTRIAQVLVPTSEVWNWQVLPGNIGCVSNHSIVEDADGKVYWVADDFTIREMEVGEISQNIDPVVKLIEPSSAHLVCGVYVEETGEIWWSIPYDNSLNNKVITLKGLSNWGELNLAVTAFGSYKEA